MKEQGASRSKITDPKEEREHAFGGLMVRSDVADGVNEFQEMEVDSYNTNSEGKGKQHGRELRDNYKRCNIGTVGTPKETRKKGAEEMCDTQ